MIENSNKNLLFCRKIECLRNLKRGKNSSNDDSMLASRVWVATSLTLQSISLP